MNYEWAAFLCFFAALWSAVIGGVFSAFSEFIMKGLLRASPAGGIESMQHINRTVVKTLFVAGIFSITVFSVGFACYALTSMTGTARFMILLAALVYLPSVFLMTLLGNVPMNNRLDRMNPQAVDAHAYWHLYSRNWTRLNHVRSLGSVATACLYAVAGISLITSTPV